VKIGFYLNDSEMISVVLSENNSAKTLNAKIIVDVLASDNPNLKRLSHLFFFLCFFQSKSIKCHR
jgi:hypothetical protein